MRRFGFSGCLILILNATIIRPYRLSQQGQPETVKCVFRLPQQSGKNMTPFDFIDRPLDALNQSDLMLIFDVAELSAPPMRKRLKIALRCFARMAHRQPESAAPHLQKLFRQTPPTLARFGAAAIGHLLPAAAGQNPPPARAVCRFVCPHRPRQTGRLPAARGACRHIAMAGLPRRTVAQTKYKYGSLKTLNPLLITSKGLNLSTPRGNRTPVTAVKGRCPNR